MAVLKIIHQKNALPYKNQNGQKYHDENALRNVIAYCCDPDKTEHHHIYGIGVSVQDAAEQMEGLAAAYRKTSGIRLRHMVLSFEPREKISLYKVNQIAYQAAWYYGRKYQIIYAVHEDRDHLHIHFVMNTVSYVDGHKYAGKKEDYYAFQRYLADILATYRLRVVVCQ